jgi:hypothetical protein
MGMGQLYWAEGLAQLCGRDGHNVDSILFRETMAIFTHEYMVETKKNAHILQFSVILTCALKSPMRA